MTKKRLVVVIVLGLSLLMGVVLTITLLNGEKWKALAVDTISGNITTELVISDVEINILRVETSLGIWMQKSSQLLIRLLTKMVRLQRLLKI